KALPGSDATVENVHWGYFRPWVRPWWGAGFSRPWGFGPAWGWGFSRPWWGWGLSRPWWGWGGFRPGWGWGGFRPWWGWGFSRPSWGWGFSQPWWGISYADAPTSSIGYAGRVYAESVPTAVSVTQLGVPARSAWPPAGPESLPTPLQP